MVSVFQLDSDLLSSSCYQEFPQEREQVTHARVFALGYSVYKEHNDSLLDSEKRHGYVSQSPIMLIAAVFLTILQSTLCHHEMSCNRLTRKDRSNRAYGGYP